jgi:pimeloyl-ACP methyl ester carboxylesterase
MMEGERRGRSRLGSVTAVILFGMAAVGCAGDPATSVGPAQAQASLPSSDPSASTGHLEGRFDIGDGRSLYMRCEGTGSPTVVMEAGDNSNASTWDPIYWDIAAETRVCAYDRAGIDPRQPAEGCRELDDLTGDLEGLLKAAEVDGPYVMVAASGGGFIVSSFASVHPEEVAGIVFIDVPGAIQDRFLTPHLAKILRCDAPTNIERRDYVQVERDAWGARDEIGDIPVSIISVDYGPDAPAEQRGNVAYQRGWLVLSPQAIQVVAHTGHDVHWDDPALVLGEIVRVIEDARTEA